MNESAAEGRIQGYLYGAEPELQVCAANGRGIEAIHFTVWWEPLAMAIPDDAYEHRNRRRMSQSSANVLSVFIPQQIKHCGKLKVAAWKNTRL